jgi:hypothetical protein
MQGNKKVERIEKRTHSNAFTVPAHLSTVKAAPPINIHPTQKYRVNAPKSNVPELHTRNLQNSGLATEYITPNSYQPSRELEEIVLQLEDRMRTMSNIIFKSAELHKIMQDRIFELEHTIKVQQLHMNTLTEKIEIHCHYLNGKKTSLPLF